MKEEEFNLSEKDHNMSMMPGDEEEHMYLQKDIKEFIKRLKYQIFMAKPWLFSDKKERDIILKEIDKLAGDDLS